MEKETTALISGRNKTMTLSAFVLMLLSIGIDILWINAFNSADTQSERVASFLGNFPSFISLNAITGIKTIICLTAIILSGLSLTQKGTFWKVLNIVILVGSGCSLLLVLFSLL